jgi:predicted N-acetyltransferase YhbS
VTVTVRQARPEELTTAGEVVLQAYLADGFLTADDPYSDHLRDAPGRARDSVVLVAVEDDEIVGSVTWCPVGSSHREIGREGEGEFRALGVLPTAQGRGIGEQLVRACLDRARQAGYHAVVLSSGDWMHAAHRVYERLGFVRIPERDWTPVPGVNLLAYRVALA